MCLFERPVEVFGKEIGAGGVGGEGGREGVCTMSQNSLCPFCLHLANTRNVGLSVCGAVQFLGQSFNHFISYCVMSDREGARE